MVLAVIFALLIMTIVGLPSWPYSTNWTYVPSGAFGAVAVTLAVLVVLRRP